MSSSLFRKFSFKREKEKQEAEEQVVPPETIQEEDKERGQCQIKLCIKQVVSVQIQSLSRTWPKKSVTG